MSTKIVFISHQADRTGAPILLLNLLHWFKQHQNIEFLIILLQEGELENEFAQLAETHIWNKYTAPTIWQRGLKRIGKKFKANYDKLPHQLEIIAVVKKFAPDIIYSNTIVSIPLGIELKEQAHCPLICHAHELAMVIDHYFGKENFTSIIQNVDYIIAGSGAVALNLQHNHQVAAKLIRVIHEFVPVLNQEDFIATRSRIRTQHQVAANALIVVGAGTIDWRKAPDLFIQVAQYVKSTGIDNIQFIWIGGNLDSSDGKKVMYDLTHAGVGQCVSFLGAQTNFDDFLSIADVFLLTSREDPYPLVCLQAASLSKPIICFAKAGGMPEFVDDDCGMVVPYLRTDLMAAEIVRLSIDKVLLTTLGTNAAIKVRQRNTIDIAGQHIFDLICNLSV